MTDKDPRDKDLPLADPRKTWWTAADIAVHWGVKQTTIHVYRTIPGRLPEEDDRIGGKPVWRPDTITSFRRPGQGARTDLKDRDDS